MHLHKYPFVRLFIPFAIGIWIASKYQISIPNQLLLWMLPAIFASLLFIYFFLKSYRLRWVFGGLLSLLLLVSGMQNTYLRDPSRDKNHLLNDTTTYLTYFARVTEPPLEREKSTRLQIEIVAVSDGIRLIQRSGRMIGYLSQQDSLNLPVYGQLIKFSKSPVVIPPSLNPDQFDYQTYLNRNNIFHQVFLKPEEWVKDGMGYVNPLFNFSYKLRDYLLNALKSNHLEGETFGVAAAILLGYDDQLPAYLRQGYTAAGAMHVLTVSGLHVGIVFLFFQFLLGFLRKGKLGKGLKTMLLILLIWFYALLTGLSPSVLRAAIMLTFILLAKTFKRKGYVINSMAASAFILLVMNPSTLFHIGFQLSYIAVLGIVLFQKPIYSLLFVKNKLLNYVWEITSVAIAAQLATTPLVLHYFNQFPTYFLLGNLILVPLSFVVIVSGMALLVTSFIPFVANYLGWITSGLIYLMNYVILWIEQLPAAVLHNIYISAFETGFFFVLLLVILQIFHERIHNFILPGMLIILILFSSFVFRSVKHEQQAALVIYGINKQTAIDLIYGKEHVLIGDSAMSADTFNIGFNLQKHWVKRGLTGKLEWIGNQESYRNYYVHKSGPVIRFLDKTIVIWSREVHQNYDCQDGKLKADILLITGNTKEVLQKLKPCLQPSLIVLDLSVPLFQATKWKERAKEMEIQLHDIREQGAYVWSNQ